MKLNARLLFRFLFVSGCLLVPVIPSLAQANQAGDQGIDGQQWINVFVLIVCAFLLLVIIYMLKVLKTLMNYVRPPAETKPFFATLMKKLSDAVPVEEEAAILTDHDYDGIRELDNNLPLWWKYLFYLTIVFGVVYFYYYQMGDGLLQTQEYKQEIATANREVEEYLKKSANSVDENSVNVLADNKRIENGKNLFLQNCAACHGKSAEGGVGPNLTDPYWLHGGGIKDVFKTIKYGVPQKGMISWKSQLSPGNIQEVASYILTLKDSHPANAKEPQGELYKEDVAQK